MGGAHADIAAAWGEGTPGALVRGRDPRLRIIAAVAIAPAVVALRSPTLLGAALLWALLLAILARLPAAGTGRRLAAVEGFMVVMLAMLPFTTPGEPLIVIAGWPASHEGLLRAIEIVLTANAVTLAVLALVGTMEVAVLGHALAGLGVPAKLVQLLLFTVRYVAVLGREYHRLRTAMRARAFRLRGDLHGWRSLGYLFGMLLVRASERAERILAAMRCRGFDGRLHVAELPPPRAADWAFAAAVLVPPGILLWIEFA